MIGAFFSDHSANRLELTEENNPKWLMKSVQELSGKSSVSFYRIFRVFGGKSKENPPTKTRTKPLVPQHDIREISN